MDPEREMIFAVRYAASETTAGQQVFGGSRNVSGGRLWYLGYGDVVTTNLEAGAISTILINKVSDQGSL